MAISGGDNGLGFLPDQIVHDRKVVGRQIPEDVDVVLEQTQVDSRRIIVVQISERSIVNEFPDSVDRASE